LFSSRVFEEGAKGNCCGKSNWQILYKQVVVNTVNSLFNVVLVLELVVAKHFVDPAGTRPQKRLA